MLNFLYSIDKHRLSNGYQKYYFQKNILQLECMKYQFQWEHQF